MFVTVQAKRTNSRQQNVIAPSDGPAAVRRTGLRGGVTRAGAGGTTGAGAGAATGTGAG